MFTTQELWFKLFNDRKVSLLTCLVTTVYQDTWTEWNAAYNPGTMTHWSFPPNPLFMALLFWPLQGRTSNAAQRQLLDSLECFVSVSKADSLYNNYSCQLIGRCIFGEKKIDPGMSPSLFLHRSGWSQQFPTLQQ